MAAANASACPWLNGTSGELHDYRCVDGSSCNLILDGLYCCDCHQGIAACPVLHEHMCVTTKGRPACATEPCDDLGWTFRKCPPASHVTPADCTPPPSPSPPSLPSPPDAPPASAQHMVSTVPELRLAVADARSQIIYVADGVYDLDAQELLVQANVTLIAQGGVVVLDAHASAERPSRVLRIDAAAHVTLRNLTLTGAYTLAGSRPGGGAIANEGNLHVYGCEVHSNVGWFGGGVFIESVVFT